jgi:drug/metabolite transporter (DMT)-like permease
MSISVTLSTLLCVLGISAGQLLFKKAAANISGDISLLTLVQNGWLVGALFLYGITTIGWVWILRHAPLHLAYPFMSLAFLIVPVLAWAVLGEPIHWRTFAGAALIIAGVSLAATS